MQTFVMLKAKEIIMPVTEKKLKSGKVQVSTTNGVKAKATTKAKADAQSRLLNAVDHGWNHLVRKNDIP